MIIPSDTEQVDWDAWAFTETAVLTFIRGSSENWLLINKKRGLGKGKVNAPGGRIDPGETALEAAVRECQEEVGLTPHTLRESAELNFIFKDGYSLKGFVFIAEGYSGELTETDEADPFWCEESKIPYEKMWEDDQYWLPQMFRGERVRGRFIFDDDRMLSRHVEVLGEHLPC